SPVLHGWPPITLRKVWGGRPWLLVGAVVLAVLFGVGAAIDGGRLLVWDRPITDAVVRARSPGVDRVALWMSRLGSSPLVLAAGLAGAALDARRCRLLALAMLVTVAARPQFASLVKEIVPRPRPSGARLVAGIGFAYPSGHVLAAAAT
ncbi:MAG: hypothetical protein ACRDZS_12695, partial [Acidimicrobiales bacterium]